MWSTTSFLSVILVVLASSSLQVHGQTNYLLASFEAAMELQEEYVNEIDYWRDWLTIEADDMGYYFTDMVAQGIELSSSAAQGAAIGECGRTAHNYSRANINYMADTMRDTEIAGNSLHVSVMLQLSNMNIKEADLELFYYYHGYAMDEAYYNLWNDYADRMFFAWIYVLFDFYYVYDILFYCVSDALYPIALPLPPRGK